MTSKVGEKLNLEANGFQEAFQMGITVAVFGGKLHFLKSLVDTAESRQL
jgi:hypothetical protein